MPLIALDEQQASVPSFWQAITEGGPLYLLLHLLFAFSIVAAVAVIFRRLSLPWMLLISCTPYICASAAAHFSFVSHLSMLDSTAAPVTLVAPFLYARHLFDWGCVISALLVLVSLCLRPKPPLSIGPIA